MGVVGHRALAAGFDEVRALLKWSEASDTTVIAAGVGEMDFGIAPEIRSALHETVTRSRVGYPAPEAARECFDAFAEWAAVHYGWRPAPETLRAAPGVLPGYWSVLRYCVPKEWPVVVSTPGYGPLEQIPRRLGRRVLHIPMEIKDGAWIRRVDALERAMDGGPALVVLCNPDNPTGSVASAQELSHLSEVVEAAGGLVFSDEIQAPLVLNGAQHIPYAAVSAEAAAHSVVAHSATKAWGLSGLPCAHLAFGNEEVVAAWDARDHRCSPAISPLAMVAATTAYRGGAYWPARITTQLERNQQHLQAATEVLSPHAPRPRAGFYSWLDLRPWLPPDTAATAASLLRDIGVVASDGREFDAPGWARLNFAAAGSVVTAMAERLLEIPQLRTSKGTP
ncbi:aminotransferase class I/II-fold pyridoxal phosphate-dependent enzyme [Streptomyces sp. NPDC006208]|uniref:aminotransferase class I/II-fold pyridoxal phosphate-dependent enzyme n=1 Tax=Streptomyces sp. NPDC006208 TaxID=3156734 RepID=UPI0033A3706B